MAIPVCIPNLHVEDNTVTIGDWLVESGHRIEIGDHLVELQLTGIVYVLSAETEGCLGGILSRAGDIVREGDVIAWMETPEMQSPDTGLLNN